MKSFKTYSGKEGARAFADELVGDLANQSSITNLTVSQADDALAAFTVLNKFREETGQNVSLVTAVSTFCSNKKRLKDRTLDEAVSGFLQNVATVQAIEIGKAVKDFLDTHEQLAHTADGGRSQISKNTPTIAPSSSTVLPIRCPVTWLAISPRFTSITSSIPWGNRG